MRWLKDLRYFLFYKLVTRPAPQLVVLGDECQWTFSEERLTSSSNVLSAGAGNDISFELALVARYGCRVVLLDPSPTGLATVKREKSLPSNLVFAPVGLAGTDGLLAFQRPIDAKEGSYLGSIDSGPETECLPCKTLSTLMRELEWTHIDLLKIDIEGFEFEVLEEILGGHIDVRQICVEFHHGAQFGRRRNETARMILSLKRSGYDLVHRVFWDHTFVRRKR